LAYITAAESISVSLTTFT